MVCWKLNVKLSSVFQNTRGLYICRVDCGTYSPLGYYRLHRTVLSCPGWREVSQLEFMMRTGLLSSFDTARWLFSFLICTPIFVLQFPENSRDRMASPEDSIPFELWLWQVCHRRPTNTVGICKAGLRDKNRELGRQLWGACPTQMHSEQVGHATAALH